MSCGSMIDNRRELWPVSLCVCVCIGMDELWIAGYLACVALESQKSEDTV